MSIPAGPRLRPYIVCEDARSALAFYRGVFGMSVELCLQMPDGRIGHAELKLPELWLYVSDPFPEMGIRAPADGHAVSLSLFVDDVDAIFSKATAAGAEVERAPEDAFHGNRVAVVVDPFGHRWMLQTQIEDLSADEVLARFETQLQG